jgi:hypothetical protein
MKKICFFILLSVFINGTVFPGLTLIQPKGGETLIMGSTYPIKWTGPNIEGEQQVDIYLGTQLIADHCKKKDGSFNWTVGRLKNGSFVAPGQYSIVLESLDGDAFGGKFTIIAMPLPLRRIPRLEIIPLPDECPVCYRIDLRKIKMLIKKTRERFHLKLYKNNRLAANLGQFGGGSSLPDFAKIKIPGKGRELTGKSPGFTYQLKLFDSRGELVETQKVTLVIKNQR